jgi:transposase-like protein
MAKTVNQIKQKRFTRFTRKALTNSISSISKERLLCPFCQSSKLIRRGTNKNKSEQKQKYFCANCIKYTVNPISPITKNS